MIPAAAPHLIPSAAAPAGHRASIRTLDNNRTTQRGEGDVATACCRRAEGAHRERVGEVYGKSWPTAGMRSGMLSSMVVAESLVGHRILGHWIWATLDRWRGGRWVADEALQPIGEEIWGGSVSAPISRWAGEAQQGIPAAAAPLPHERQERDDGVMGSGGEGGGSILGSEKLERKGTCVTNSSGR